MKLILFICGNDSPCSAIKRYLPKDYLLLEEEASRRGLHALKELASGVVLVDATDQRIIHWLKEAYSARPDLVFFGVTDDRERVCPDIEEKLGFIFHPPFRSQEINKLLESAQERSRFLSELKALRNSGGHKSMDYANGVGSYHLSPRKNARVLCDFSKALSNNFNRERLLELFSDAVLELVPVGRLSIVLWDETDESYMVAFQKGLDPSFCSTLRFLPDQGLIRWLAERGRVLLREEAAASATLGDSEVIQEMKLLHAAVSVPLQAYGYLNGSLNLGPKVTGAAFTEEELEILFVLCGNVTIALRDIDLHHQLLYQKSYIENILQRMGSGVLAINNEEKIIACNRRAREILSLENERLIGRDLRWLPSPLGDILYETMRTGKEYYKYEHQLAGSSLFLEISANQLVNEERKVLGSVMILDDVSQRRQLEEERRQADRLDVLNRFVGHLAHEIKNPMVAIQTFSELLPEKYDDSDFRIFFNHTVRQEVKRLNEMVEQLIAFSSPLTYNFVSAEVHEVIDMGLSLLREQGKVKETSIETSYTTNGALIRADRTLLPRAFSYLLRSSFQVIERRGRLFIETRPEKSHFVQGGICVSFWDSDTVISKSELKNMFHPLAARQDDLISLELPVSIKIIENHEGYVTAFLKDDGRLVFNVFLPLITGGGSEQLV